MITVNVKKLIEAIEEETDFKMPNMNVGTEYLYNNLYGRLSRDEDVYLSNLDFDAFYLEDLGEMESLYNDVLETNEHKADNISGNLRRLPPIASSAIFV